MSMQDSLTLFSKYTCLYLVATAYVYSLTLEKSQHLFDIILLFIVFMISFYSLFFIYSLFMMISLFHL